MKKASLKLWIDPSAPLWLKDEYSKRVVAHHESQKSSAPFEDAGFDLLVPENLTIQDGQTLWIDHKIKCAMYLDDIPTGFYLYPRSSITKTPLMLANQTGIIDAGYRGNIFGAFRKMPVIENVPESITHHYYNDSKWKISQNTRLLQVCHPQLYPIQVSIVNNESELGSNTVRGIGGFGSTS